MEDHSPNIDWTVWTVMLRVTQVAALVLWMKLSLVTNMKVKVVLVVASLAVWWYYGYLQTMILLTIGEFIQVAHNIYILMEIIKYCLKFVISMLSFIFKIGTPATINDAVTKDKSG